MKTCLTLLLVITARKVDAPPPTYCDKGFCLCLHGLQKMAFLTGLGDMMTRHRHILSASFFLVGAPYWVLFSIEISWLDTWIEE